jgi:hypothetical protein
MTDDHVTPSVTGSTERASGDDTFSPSSANRLSRRAAAGYVACGGIAAALLLTAGGRTALGQATPQAQGEEANYFVLSGEGTQITFATTSLTGLPLLTYQGPLGSHSFTGDQIRREDTGIGELVTAGPLEAVPDLYEVTLTVLVPDINLIGGSAETPIATLAVLTTHHTSIGGPGGVQGALQTYEAVALQGTAESVNF